MDEVDSTPDPTSLPRFEVKIPSPDLSHWLAGSDGVPGVITFAATEPGPHVAMIALTHGNELAGAVVLDAILRAGLRPLRGRLTFVFANLAAFARFDPEQPTASRFVDEDLNRLWEPAILDGPRQSSELRRARELRPVIDSADIVLDLHSMLWPSEPLLLCGATAKGIALGEGVGTPPLLVSDRGHVSGRRLIDYDAFADADSPRVAALVEAGQHWEPGTIEMTRASVAGLLRHTGMATDHAALPKPPGPMAQRMAVVTTTVTAVTGSFVFVRPFRGGDIISRRDTLIALDGTIEIRTPHDDCLLVMPSLRPSRGHTAVRLARFVEPSSLLQAP